MQSDEDLIDLQCNIEYIEEQLHDAIALQDGLEKDFLALQAKLSAVDRLCRGLQEQLDELRQSVRRECLDRKVSNQTFQRLVEEKDRSATRVRRRNEENC